MEEDSPDGPLRSLMPDRQTVAGQVQEAVSRAEEPAKRTLHAAS